MMERSTFTVDRRGLASPLADRPMSGASEAARAAEAERRNARYPDIRRVPA